MDREFYVADSFDRYNADTCSVDALCGSIGSISADYCNTGSVAADYCKATAATSVSFMDAMDETRYKMDDVVSALKELGKRLGVTIDNDGRIVSNQKMNFKFPGQRRLRRCELKTLQGTF